MSAGSPKETDLSFTDEHFFSSVFTQVSRKRVTLGEQDPLKAIFTEEYDEISQELDKTLLQESCSVRNVSRTATLADVLIDDKGELNSTLLPKLIANAASFLYSTGPNRQYDSRRQEQILKVLKLLQTDKNLVRLLKNISKPISHRHAEQIIRDTLQLPANATLTDAHARRAALAAWLCYLRQSVGSCFATAPAIIVHDEQPDTFLMDLNDLLSTGRMKRTFGGIEYIVPLSSSWGAGDARKPFFLVNEGHLFEIWKSPGLIQALSEIGLIAHTRTKKHKQAQAKQLIEQLVKEWRPHHGQPLITTMEELLKRLLLTHHQLTEKDITDYESRPKEFIHSNLIIKMPRDIPSSGSKGEACEQFKNQLKQARSAFNSISNNALLKAWEFSLASFAETKADFTRWNLYSSLGFQPEEQGGIGQALFEILQKKIDSCQDKMREIQGEYEQLYAQLKYVESRIKNASTEKEINWLRVEHQAKSHEFYTLQDLRDGLHDKAKRFAGLYNVMINFYDRMFPQYFQEVYDADMHIATNSFYDDSPAGFRLIFKHGRGNTSQWTGIHTPDEFINNLTSFFIATENELASDPNLSGLENDLPEIITHVITRIKTKEFLETSFHRMAIAHKTAPIKNPLDHLDKIEKKPWMYTSGGTMGSLVSCYFRREQKPTEVERWVESEVELLVFFIDTFKQIPIKVMQEYIDNPNKSMLIHSPTHAFLLKPGLKHIKDAWGSDVFTFTWVRDQLIQPMKKFIENLTLSEEMMVTLVQLLSMHVPKQLRHEFQNAFRSFPGTMRPHEFRRYVLETLSLDKAFRQVRRSILSPHEIDSLLFTHLPLFSGSELKEKITSLFNQIKEVPDDLKAKITSAFDQIYQSKDYSAIISAKELQNIAKALICLATKSTSHPVDFHRLISKSAQELGYALPMSILFADSNWPLDDFGFTVNPGTGVLEMWRMDEIGNAGSPMTDWSQWLNGSRQDIKWGIYTRPYEYTLT